MVEDLKQKEKSLREILLSKPQNGKILSQLSSTLLELSKVNEKGEQHVDNNLREEAVKLGNRVIEVAQSKPYGYVAMSMAAPTWKERKEALVQAIDRSSSDTFRIARIGLLVRLLLEEREEEARGNKGKVGSASPAHPNRRNLSAAELKIYQRVVNDLDQTWSGVEMRSELEQEFLSKQEFRLGCFFRKKLPSSMHAPRARKHFENARRLRKNKMADFWLATLQEGEGGLQIDRCPATYVVSLYSTFASRFDELLVEKLQYETPTKLRMLLDDTSCSAIEDQLMFQNACDLGCGTGLSGIAFRDRVKGSLLGVDLSPEMLDKARSRGCYQNLCVGDVETGLAEFTHRFDLVTACDVFCYIGDLRGVFDAVYRSLLPGGYFCFSVELLPITVPCSFQLHACARFSHKQMYVEGLAKSRDFEIIKMQSTIIRKNQGKDVLGLLVILLKRS